MPATRKTRSGRSAPAPPSKRIRTKGGCLTCRIRRKKCDESRDHQGGCETCARLHIECLGFSSKRPEWLKGSHVDSFKRRIKHFLADHNAKSSSRSQDNAFLYLHNSPTSTVRTDSEESSDTGSEPDPVPAPYAWETSAGSYSDPDYLCSAGEWPVSTFDFNCLSVDPYVSGNDNAEPSFYLGTPGLLDFPPMLNLDEPSLFDQDPQHILLMASPYDPYDPEPNAPAIWDSFFGALKIQDTSLETSLVEAIQGDPEGFDAIIKELAGPEQSHLLEHGQTALHRLCTAGYDKGEARALTCLWMMASSLSKGSYNNWGTCLDLVLSWVKNACSTSVDVSNLGATEKLILQRSIWSDMIAGATTKRPPLNIDLYRRILATNGPDVLDGCSNSTALAIAEVASLAAFPDQHGGAATQFQRVRTWVPLPDATAADAVASKQEVHKAGARLFLEVIAHQGATDEPAVRDAAHTVRTLVGKVDKQRDFAFWIFLAGCHTTDNDGLTGCSATLNNIMSMGGDASVGTALDVMHEIHAARLNGTNQAVPSHMWRERMVQLGALLV